MTRRRSFLRAVALVFAAIQLASVAGAPVMEAFALSGDAIPLGDQDSFRSAPRHVHDASTCPACRLLNSDYQPEPQQAAMQVTAPRTCAVRDVWLPVALATTTLFLARAPPAPRC
jgi:hypothetical protein